MDEGEDPVETRFAARNGERDKWSEVKMYQPDDVGEIYLRKPLVIGNIQEDALAEYR